MSKLINQMMISSHNLGMVGNQEHVLQYQEPSKNQICREHRL